MSMTPLPELERLRQWYGEAITMAFAIREERESYQTTIATLRSTLDAREQELSIYRQQGPIVSLAAFQEKCAALAAREQRIGELTEGAEKMRGEWVRQIQATIRANGRHSEEIMKGLHLSDENERLRVELASREARIGELEKELQSRAEVTR